jgi:hypothetical protein
MPFPNDKIARREVGGRLGGPDPTTATHYANKGYVDGYYDASGRVPTSRASYSDALGAVDLDTVITPGVYNQGSGGNATLLNHYPVAGVGGFLEVLTRLDGAMLTQRWDPWGTAVSTNPTRFFMRWRATGTWSVWQEYVPRGTNGNPYAVAANVVSTTAVVGAANALVTVTYPAGTFTQSPIVVVSEVNAPSGTGKVTCRALSPTSTGFTFAFYQGDATTWATAVNLSGNWVATQMTSTGTE